MATFAVLHAFSRALIARAAALDDGMLPPELQTILDRCRDDLAVILAATDADIAALLDSAEPVPSFEMLASPWVLGGTLVVATRRPPPGAVSAPARTPLTMTSRRGTPEAVRPSAD